jgi:hypothetical protein
VRCDLSNTNGLSVDYEALQYIAIIGGKNYNDDEMLGIEYDLGLG